jgi:hypothetical protein
MKTKIDTHVRRLTARSADGNHGKLALGRSQSRYWPFFTIAAKDGDSKAAAAITVEWISGPHLGVIISDAGADFTHL